MTINKILSLENYTDTRKDRRKGAGGTQEFFTPYEIVKKWLTRYPKKIGQILIRHSVNHVLEMDNLFYILFIK